jgi:hypothetical protein
MKLHHYLGALWIVMAVVMIVKWKIDYLMVGALIIIPILIVLLDMHEEISVLKEEAKHQRKFVMDRFAALSERIKDFSTQLEKRMVVDFAEFAKSNPPPSRSSDEMARRRKRRKKKPLVEVPVVDFHAESGDDPTAIGQEGPLARGAEPIEPPASS